MGNANGREEPESDSEDPSVRSDAGAVGRVSSVDSMGDTPPGSPGRKVLHRSGKDHSILLVLPSGIYRYKFIVDGEWRCIPDLPFITDEMGSITQLLDVQDYVPENLDSVSEFEAPASPDSSYRHMYPLDEDFAKEPHVVPPQLHLTVLGMDDHQLLEEEEPPSKPRHVVLNHLFIEKGWAAHSLVALGLTHRFQSKYVTVILYKPLPQ
ncbi:SNF1-related protein kinase regulatory subunit beta-1 [Acorus gramineus]|uniref:SNF1-related protein kinase regulatory subunit beta-1 n=1 Tax=Acorus gramineus TaxID=55184 RepID=A0AAV9BN39_ACOGR|nr:SNF1-related protein kinase regulatory subunit beta-1 [Acorus gramineus]